MKGLADTEGSLTLQPLTATGIHNLPAMNPFTYQGVSLSKEQSYGGQNTGGKGKELHDTSPRFQTKLKAYFSLACLSNSSSRFWTVNTKCMLFEVLLVNVQQPASSRPVVEPLAENEVPQF